MSFRNVIQYRPLTRTLSRISRDYHRRPVQSLFQLEHTTQKYSSLCLCHPQGTTCSPHFFRKYTPYSSERSFTSTVDGKDEESGLSVSSPAEESANLGIPGAQKGGKKLAIVFTCTVCNTRSAKQFTEQAYNHGVVIVQCPGCNNRHLIADNLGFFEDEDGGWNIEKAMEKLGENVVAVNDDNVMELTIDDIYGKEAVENAMQSEPSKKDS